MAQYAVFHIEEKSRLKEFYSVYVTLKCYADDSKQTIQEWICVSETKFTTEQLIELEAIPSFKLFNNNLKTLSWLIPIQVNEMVEPNANLNVEGFQ